MLAYIASNALGVIRQTIFNAIFGTGPEADAFYAAIRLPDTLFNLIAGGALSFAFIPIFISYEKEYGQREAWRLTSLVFNVILVILTIFIIVGEFLTPIFVTKILVPGYPSSRQVLVTNLTRIMLMQPLILGLGTVATAVLSSKRQFLLPALSIAVYNFGMISGLLLSLIVPRIGIYGPTYGVVISSVFQILVLLAGFKKGELRYSFIWNLKHPGLHAVMKLFIPNLLGVGITSVGMILDTAYASFLADQASLAAIHNAQLLYALPLALLAQAVGQAVLPRLSSFATSNRYARLRQLTLKSIGTSIFFSIGCVLALTILGRLVIHILFQHGAFTQHSTNLTTLALLGYAVGLPGDAVAQMLMPSFYALKDARTPLFTNLFALGIRFALILLLFRLMEGSYVIMAIPLASSGAVAIDALLRAVILFARLRKRIKIDKGWERLNQRRSSVLSRMQSSEN